MPRFYDLAIFIRLQIQETLPMVLFCFVRVVMGCSIGRLGIGMTTVVRSLVDCRIVLAGIIQSMNRSFFLRGNFTVDD